ncbi:hypothetical protein [Deinococcus koreensis]|uniref:Uncharacterized protein n=1 Tax=Deinococcus koreensis TaxID=2054903 RepID=A0A2K3UUH2_9DEIO|nr:hypothetical protein [Deinococcus koreensis]PNY80168.1 hypothetical protein CVO96_01280 [Deinococcus koreensis]
MTILSNWLRSALFPSSWPLLLLAACAPAQQPAPLPDPAAFRPAPGDTRAVPEVGEMGRWMITRNLQNATWLGEKVQGRTLREPVNVVLIDRVAQTPAEAGARLQAAMLGAGYPPRNMHSDGYWGLLNGELRPQLPASGRGEAFSDGPWYGSNNHGRAFGPWKTAGGYVFTAAFSREDFRLLPRPGHTYNSFQAAREDLANRLTTRTFYRKVGYIELGSRLDTPGETTADHDGRAVLMVATQ